MYMTIDKTRHNIIARRLAIIIKLRKALHSMDSQSALEQLLKQLSATRNNAEFLMHIARSESRA